jgi:hypothetical protein
MSVPETATAVRILQPRNVTGLAYIEPVLSVLENLRAHHDCPNRILHFDQYISLLLLSFFNPVLGSLRALQSASCLEKVQHNLAMSQTSLGSLAEASRVFNPEPLRFIFEELAAQAHAQDSTSRPASLPDVMALIAADSTLFETLPRMARAFYQAPLTRCRKGDFKMHLQFNVLRGTPVDASFSAGETDDRQLLKAGIKPDTLYLIDRGYPSAELFDQIQNAGSSFVSRLKGDAHFTIHKMRPIDAAGTKAGVYFDAVVTLGKHSDARRLRVLKARIVSPPPHNLHPRRKGGKYKAYQPGQELVQEWILITDRQDLEADVLVLLYHYRWKVELFFRWFKCTLKCRHLFAESENGMKLQFYAALIASLLVVIYTQRKPNKRVWEALQFYFMGWATWAEVEACIARHTTPTKL